MSKTYSVYGLGLGTNLPIAGLTGLATASNVDVLMSLGSLPNDLPTRSGATACVISSEQDDDAEPERTISVLTESGYFRFDYASGITIVVDARGSRVWATWPDGAGVEDAATYLLGPILGFVLRLRGVTCLHASAVAIGDKAIALVGPNGAGKSSAAAAFAQLGYPVLTDDIAALADFGDSFKVHPAYPRIRLWPESVKSLFGSEAALPRIVPNWDKRYLDLNGPGYRFQRKPLPLAAVYLLGERSADAAMARVEAVGSKDGLMALIGNTYANHLIDKRKRADEFELLNRLVQSAPVRRVRPSADFARIGGFCETIAEDANRLALCTRHDW